MFRLLHSLALLSCWLLASGGVRAQLEPPVPKSELGELPQPEAGDGLPARALLLLQLDAEGSVTQADLLELDRQGEAATPFAEAALVHARQLAFAPARRDGQAVPAQIRVELRFAPAERAPSSPQPAPPQSPPAVPPPGSEPEPAPDEPARGEQLPVAPSNAAAAVPSAEFGATARLRAGTRPPTPVAASDQRIEVGALADVPRRDAAEQLTLAPGVVLVNHSGEGHAPTLFLRGFDAGEGQDVEVLLDGVPLNEPANAHTHGYADVHFVIPELVREVRVVEGPFDPRQGDFAVAGSAEYSLAAVRRGVFARASYGSFDNRRLMLTWAPPAQTEETFAAVDARQGDGFGHNRAHRSVSALAQYASPRAPLRARVLVASSALEFDSAGVIRQDAVEAGELPCSPDERGQFFCLHDPQQGGSGARHLVSAALAGRQAHSAFEQQLFASLRRHRVRENFTGFLLDPRGDGLDQQTEALLLGARGHYRVQRDLAGRPQQLELGYLARHDNGRARQWRLRAGGGEPYATVFDSDYAITNTGVYATLELQPLPWLDVFGGLRFESFAFSVVDHNLPESDREGPRLSSQARDAFGFVGLPRGGVRVELASGVSAVASVGQGARSSDPQALSEGERAPFARVFAGEAGVVLQRAGALTSEMRLIGFYTHVDDDLLFDPERGRNVPVGPSQRFGASAWARLRGAFLDTIASLSWSEAHQGGELFELTAGPRLPFVPRWVARLDAALRHHVPVASETLRLGAAVGAGYLGPRPLPLGSLSEPSFTLDAALRVGWGVVELALSGQNLLDLRNRSSELHHVSNFEGSDAEPSLRAARHFSAAPPRSLLATLTFHLPPSLLTGDDPP